MSARGPQPPAAPTFLATTCLAQTLLAPALIALTMLAIATGASAQTSRAGLTVLGGGSVHGDLTPGLASTVFQPGWMAGLHAERWLGAGRAGLRLNGTFTRRALEDEAGDFNVYMADVDLMLRLLPVRPSRKLAPYIALGGGGTHYAPVGDSPPIAGGAYGEDPVYRPHLLAAFGVDAFGRAGSGLRIEFADQIVFPSVGESPETVGGMPATHNLVLTAGLQLGLGRLRRAVLRAPSARASATETAHAAPAAAAVAETPAPARTAAPAPTASAARTQASASTPASASIPAPAAQPRHSRPMPGDVDYTPLYTVEIKTVVEPATAARWAERLRQRGIPYWLQEAEVGGQRMSLLRMGVVRSEPEARGLARAIERDYGWSVRVDRVAPDEDYPADAIAATEVFIYGR